MKEPGQHEQALVVHDHLKVHVRGHGTALHTQPIAAFFEPVQADLLARMKSSARSQDGVARHV